MKLDIPKFIQKIKILNTKTICGLEFKGLGAFVGIFNSSEDKKCFIIGLDSIVNVLNDLIVNNADFVLIKNYNEKIWRDAAGTFFLDNAGRTLAQVQTRPFFTALNMLICIGNDDLDNYIDKTINVDLDAINNSILYLNEIISIFQLQPQELVGDVNVQLSLKEEFASWLISQPTNNYFDKDFNKAIKGLQSYQEKYEEVFGKDVFEIDFSSIEKTLEEIKDHIYDSSTDFFEYSKKTSNHQPKAILGEKNYLKFLEEYKLESQISVIEGYNKIYFGSPGTGKSYAVSKKIENVDEYQIERVIFHPDYDYSSFIGGYKPITEKDSDDKDIVKYKFVPQIFINIFEKAHRNPNKNFYLVIEEINRGNCAEIFGDIFQLLDRNPDYAITPSEDLYKYLLERDQSSKIKVLKNGKLIMPNNLVILSTMNTSDQSLYPMDSAFKRRWDWEYVPIKYPMDDKDISCPSFSYRVKLDEGKYFRWIDFVANVNKHILQNPSLGLDKCIGNFFIKPDMGSIISLDTLINKVIFYLWNDVFKDEENEIFAGHTYQSYFPASEGQRKISLMIDKFRTQLPKMLFYNFTDEGIEIIADIDLNK